MAQHGQYSSSINSPNIKPLNIPSNIISANIYSADTIPPSKISIEIPTEISIEMPIEMPIETPIVVTLTPHQTDNLPSEIAPSLPWEVSAPLSIGMGVGMRVGSLNLTNHLNRNHSIAKVSPLTVNKTTFSFLLAASQASPARPTNRAHCSTGSQLLDSFNHSLTESQSPQSIVVIGTEAAQGLDLPATPVSPANKMHSKAENLDTNNSGINAVTACPKTALQSKTVSSPKAALTARAQATERMTHIVRADRALTGSRQTPRSAPPQR
jgi:hypothetical protein